MITYHVGVFDRDAQLTWHQFIDHFPKNRTNECLIDLLIGISTQKQPTVRTLA